MMAIGYTAQVTATASREVASDRACAALVNERKGSGRRFHVVSAEPIDTKSACFNQVVNLSIEMATAAEPFPHRSQPMLPANYGGIWGLSVFDKAQFTFWSQHSPHFSDSEGRVWYGAQCESHHHRVEAAIVERQFLG